MTVLDAYHIFDEQHPGAVARSTFNALRPREVKTTTPQHHMTRHEVQQEFFSQHQVTLFTIHLTIGKEQRNVAIISDYMEHTTVFVHCAQKVLTQFIKKNFPLVRKINYVSDGTCAHFKNNVSILNLIHHKIDFDLDACWTFTATEHGKGAGDGIGAVLKPSARCATLSTNILMSNAKDFYEFTQKQQLETARRSNKDIPGVHGFFLESDEIEEAKNSYLKARSEKLRTTDTLHGIRTKHEFKPISNSTIQYSLTSRSTHIRTFTFK
ncbi:unnamed protein product [Rotaria socialis]|uniref:Uncharacterized protein n=2 Tax=Rotaria socialis TaxID=392032 RepID=A0A821C3F1_9BILA|nr:unnamed protein product [Rotaria socialis]